MQSASRLSRYRRIVARIATLRPVEWWLLVRMGSLLITLLALQRLLPLPRLLQLFDARKVRASGAPISPDRLLWMTRGLLGWTFRDKYCMKQAILLFHFLRRWGHTVRLHFGVTKVQEVLQGHAWVDLNDEPFGEASDPRISYRISYSYPPD